MQHCFFTQLKKNLGEVERLHLQEGDAADVTGADHGGASSARRVSAKEHNVHASRHAHRAPRRVLRFSASY